MAGLSRSEYQASLQSQKTNKALWLIKILFLVSVIVFLPQFLLFGLGFVIVISLLLGAVKAGIDLPDYK